MQKKANIEDTSLTVDAYIPAPELHNGPLCDPILRDAAPYAHISAEKLRTVRHLLDAVEKEPPSSGSFLPMLKTTVANLTSWQNRSAEEIAISELATLLPAFKSHLEESPYKRNAVRSYVNYLQCLVRKAKQLGWREAEPELEAAWKPIMAANPKKPSCASIIRYAIRNRIQPEKFGDADLDRWQASVLALGQTASHVREVKGTFRTFILRLEFPTMLTDHSRPGGRRYGVPFEKLPPVLRSQVEELMQSKEAKYTPGRPQRCRHRRVTSLQVRDLICRIFGFLQNIRKRTATSLEEIVSKEVVEDYVGWCINERGNQGTALATWIGILLNSAKRFPPLSGKDFSWVQSFLEGIPTEGDEKFKEEKKQRKWVSLAEIRKIPGKIRADRAKRTHSRPRTIALKFRNELLMSMVPLLPWRQRNQREFKLAPSAEGGNLFLGDHFKSGHVLSLQNRPTSPGHFH